MKIPVLPYLLVFWVGSFILKDNYDFAISATLTLIPFLLTKQIKLL